MRAAVTSETEGAARVEAETIGAVRAEVHRILAADGTELALTRVPPVTREPHATPVVFVHGSYARRNFWISPKGLGVAPFLSEHGFDGWVLELRGHGLSPKGPRFAHITAEDHMRLDLAAAAQHVRAVTGRDAFWVGHSAGGLYTLGALSARWLDEARVAGVATFGSQIREGERFLRVPGIVPVCAALLRTMQAFPAPRFGLGPEVEPAGEMIEFLRWKGWRGRWASSTGHDYQKGLNTVRAPVISFAGAADQADPPEGCRALLEACGGDDKSFVTLGRASGYTRDYGHVDMVVSKEAAAEVWPVLARWLDARRSRAS